MCRKEERMNERKKEVVEEMFIMCIEFFIVVLVISF